MASSRLTAEQRNQAALFANFERRGNVAAATRSLPAASKGIPLVVEELGGGNPIKITLKGSFGLETGAEWASELRGETRTPLGSSEGYSTVTGRTFGKTDMTLALDAAFLRRDDIEVQNVLPPADVDQVRWLFEALQDRGRDCLVQFGGLIRRGVLRNVTAAPGRGHSLGLDGTQGVPGFNLSLKLTWEWSGRGEPVTREPPLAASDIAGKIAGSDAKWGEAISLATDVMPTNVLDQLKGSIGRIRGEMSKLRRSLRQIGSFARAPADILNATLATARGVGNLLNDFENEMGDTRDAFLALGPAAQGTARGLGASVRKLTLVRVARKAIREAVTACIEAVVDVFDAIDRKLGRRVSVRPGQSLADVARVELGNADLWPIIAMENKMSGQIVPPGRTYVIIPFSTLHARTTYR